MVSRRTFLLQSSVGAATAVLAARAASASESLPDTRAVPSGDAVQTKILYIGGGRSAGGWAEPSTVLEGIGFGSGTPHLEYEFYEHLAIHEIIKNSVSAEQEGYDAVVIGCFYDPGLREARELVKIPVVGVCEASLHVASMLCAGKFSVLVGRQKWIPKMADNANIYGFESRIASWRVLDLTVPDMRDRERTRVAILREAKAAKEEDQAECAVLGCTGMARQAKAAEEELGIPVLDPVLMGLKVAEMRATLWKRFGISHSKHGGYESPPPEELAPIYEKTYGRHPTG